MNQKDDELKKANRYGEIAEDMHRFYGGKMETVPKCVVRDMDDFSVWYSPGVAQPCLAIQEDPDKVYEYTSKWNTVAVISDGSRVLGLGDIGPKAGLPVMEGKAMLYKYLGGVDSVAIMLDTKDPDEIIQTVLRLQPSFGGINLEDLSQPKCFRILDTLRREAEIPVWHDDQQGTATVTLAGLLSALRVQRRAIEDVRIAFIGTGAANVACARLIFARGARAEQCFMVDSRGILGTFREDIYKRRVEFREKWQLCENTNAEGRQGGIAEALKGADVVISLAQPGPGTIKPEWIAGMAPDPIVFTCANPVPEIWPWEAKEAGAAIVATGRSDFPNQVNNSLCFPGIFRGALDVRAKTITDEMCFAAADALVAHMGDTLGPENLLPTMEDWKVFPEIAAAVGLKAQEQGVARVTRSRQELYSMAEKIISRSRRVTQVMMEEGLIEEPPVLE
ncbi:NAD(P)-dependent malic enzyme [Spirochaeta lutea]|uniref:Malate dehydrogenase n=1 Tax=Spirochaeta lutea TaxID=1480694 RepID=A0A098QUD0_9SPIO|nr:NADP-dependent malic enzyme [Spirochaeta lutea]KGE71008.1 malate dehydrogenase [Spirochaeta lutea]